MTYHSWKDALKELQGLVGPTTALQRAIAETSGVHLPPQLPQLVAAARLRENLQAALGTTTRGPATDRQLELLDTLAKGAGRTVLSAESMDEVDAWIRYFYLRHRHTALKRLQLCKGDLVRIINAPLDEVDEVSSIGSEDIVWLRGRGARAWPDLLEVVL